MKQNSKMFLLLLGTCLNANINSFPYSAWTESIIDIISITVAEGWDEDEDDIESKGAAKRQ